MKSLKEKLAFKIATNITIVFLATIASAQTKSFNQKYGTEEDYNRLRYLNIQYIQSWVKSDTATYNRLLWAEDWVQQNAGNGSLASKKQMLPLFGKPRFESLEYFYCDNVNVQFISPDAAMVYAETPLGLKGDPLKRLSQYNDIYIRRNGQWICVSANITKVRKPEDAPTKFVKVTTPPQLTSWLPGTDKDKKELKELNDKRAEAFAHSKSELLENILSDDFTLLAGNGLLYKKKEVLEQVKAAAKTNITDHYNIENMFIRFVAPDVAMVHAAMVITRKDGTQSGTQYNDIYVKRENNWVCVSGNNTPITL